MDELECMKQISELLQEAPDDAARTRIAAWVSSRFGGVGAITNNGVGTTPASGGIESGQIAGIAKLSNSGEVQLTVRDFKARSANEAASRLVHVFLWANKRLTGSVSASSKAAIVPWLRKYRCYDGNTRKVIARDKGLVRDGDELSLDFHAEQLAEKYVQEILDSATEGRWKPGSAKRRSRTGGQQ